jgi:uncharacterized protein YdaU (DUF1376 family)
MHFYQFYIADYRKDTAHLTRLEHSIYRDLIDWYYLDEKPISKDMSFVSRRLKLSTKSEIESFNNVIQDFFVEQDDGYHHQKIDDEICEYHKKCDVNSTNGKKGGRPKGKRTQTVSERLANAMPTVSDIEPNQKAISNQYSVISNHESVISKHETINNIKDKETTPPKPPKGGGDEFEQFWQAYPKKVGKDKAEASFKKIRSCSTVLPEMLKALEWQKASDQWTRDNGQFIPLPTTYLNQGRWKDEAVQVAFAKRQPNKQELLEMQNLAVVHEMMRSA